MQTEAFAQRFQWRVLRRQAGALWRAFGLVWQATGYRTLLWGALYVVQGLLPAASVLLTRVVVDGLALALRTEGDWTRWRPVLVPVLLMAGIALLTEALSGLMSWLRGVQAELVQDYIKNLTHRQAATLDLAYYEEPEFYDQLHRVCYEAGTRPTDMLEGLGRLMQNSVTLFAIAAVLLPYGLWIPAALVVSTLPALGVVLWSSLRRFRWQLAVTAEKRRALYYEGLLTDREVASELRLFDLGDRFIAAYQAIRRRLRKEGLALARAQGLASFGAGAFALLMTGVALGMMFWQAPQSRLTLGTLALFYQAFQQGQRLMRDLLGDVGHLYAHSLFLRELFDFLALRPRLADPSEPVPAPETIRQGVRFDQVTFRYPGCEQPALDRFDLTIPAGQTVAIVGTNGSGKSTLVKLLCRLYDPEDGAITLDGIDLRAFRQADLRRLISAIFQSPVAYSATAAENIALSYPAALSDAAELDRAAQAAGARETIERLPQGYDTLLGRGFEQGMELSGGQWQRIALARALIRPAPLLLLDEPTSALDAWAEAEWLQRFRRFAEGHTVVIITHRFTTAMHADIIHVMDRGRVVESGSHRELLAQGGRYARSWQLQQQWANAPTETPQIVGSA